MKKSIILSPNGDETAIIIHVAQTGTLPKWITNRQLAEVKANSAEYDAAVKLVRYASKPLPKGAMVH